MVRRLGQTFWCSALLHVHTDDPGELERHVGADSYSLQEPVLSTAGRDRQTRER
jgi:hypothetical protein